MGRAVSSCRVYAILFILFGFLVTPSQGRAQNPFSSGVPELDELDIRMSEPYGAGRFSETIPMHKQAIVIAEKALGRDHPTTIKRIEDCGHILSITGHTEEAKTYFERALAAQKRVIAKKKKVPVDDVATLAGLYLYTEQFDKAETVYKQVLEMREKLAATNDPINNAVFARTIDELAMVYNRQGRFAEETIMRGRAVAAWEKSDKTSIVPGTAMTDAAVIMLISSYSVLGRHAEAEAVARRALAREQKSGESATTSYSISMLADIVAAQGRLEEAEKLYRRAMALERKFPDKTSPVGGLAVHLNGLAGVLLKLGRYDEAEAAATEALTFSSSKQAERDENSFTVTIFVKLAQANRGKRRYAKAEEFYRRALALANRTGEQESPKIGRILGELAELDLAMGKVPEAYDLGKRATTLLIRHIRNRGSALTMSPSGQLRPDDYYHKPTFMAHLRAASALAKQSPDRAAELAAETFAIAQWAQHSHAAASLSQMAARFAKGEGKLAELVRKRQDLVLNNKLLQSKITEAMSKPASQRIKSQEDRWLQSVEEIERSIGDITAALARDFPDYAALANPEPVAASDMQALLRPDEALLQMAIDTRQSFAWVVTQSGVRWEMLEVDEKQLASDVAVLRCGLDESGWQSASGGKTPPPSRCQRLLNAAAAPQAGVLQFDLARAHGLYTKLLAPFETEIRDKQLLVVPSGPLTTLPLHVLVTAMPDPSLTGNAAYAKAAWLGLQQAVTIVPSATSVKSLRVSASRSAATAPFAGFANPLLTGASGTDRSAWSRQSCTGSPPALQQVAMAAPPRAAVTRFYRGRQADVAMIRQQTPLPETADEVCFVAQSLGAPPEAVYLGGNATEAKIKSLSASGTLKSYRVLHFATHGLIAGETQILTANQAEPALLLTPPDVATEQDDGLLTASEVAKLVIDADWVILSACNTAAADGSDNAEALSGLASAFLYAGGRSLLVSHWYVNSEAAVQLITKTVGILAQQPALTRSEAMRRSITSHIRAGGLRSHPSYWAPFIIVGHS